MIHTPILLPNNWLHLVKQYDISKIKNKTAQNIAKNVQLFILDKQENIIGSRKIQLFLNAVINNNFEIYNDFKNIPKLIIDEAFSEIRGETGLNFCKKIDSITAELQAFQDILAKEKFLPFHKKRKDGDSDFLIEKDNLQYDAEVKFKMSDKSLCDLIESLICGYAMLPKYNFLAGIKVIINIKIDPSKLNNSNNSRIYAKVQKWLESSVISNFSDNDLEITIKNLALNNILDVQCGTKINRGIIPDPNSVHSVLKNHLLKIQKQFLKRQPKRSIGIIIWSTPWNYNFDEEDFEKSKKNIIIGINKLLKETSNCCDKLYVYPTGLKEHLLFK